MAVSTCTVVPTCNRIINSIIVFELHLNMLQADDPLEFLSGDLWRKRSVKNGKVKLTNTKEIARYIQRAGNYEKALLKVILETDSTKFSEASVSSHVMALLPKCGIEHLFKAHRNYNPGHLNKPISAAC